MPGRPMTVEDLWALPRVGSPVPAPDGSRYVVPVTTYNLETNEGTTRLWLGDARSAEGLRPLTTAETNTGQPAWHPDGNKLAFTRKPGGPKGDGKAKPGAQYPDQPQLYVMPLDGGEPERVTDLPLGVADPRYFPDGNRIAFLVPLICDKGPDGAVITVERTAEILKARADDPVKVRVSEDRIYRFWDKWLTDGRLHHVFVLDLGTRELTDLMPSSERWFSPMDPSDAYRIHPAGHEIVFSACRSLPPHDPLVWGIFQLDVASRVTVEITPPEASNAERPIYSPDGDTILYGMQRDYGFYADRTRLAVYHRATGQHRVLTEAWDRSAFGWVFGAAADTVYLGAEEDARTSLWAFDFGAAMASGAGSDSGGGASGAATNPGGGASGGTTDPADSASDPSSPGAAEVTPRLLVRGGHCAGPQVAGGRLFTAIDTLVSPPEVATCALDGSDLRVVSAFAKPGLDPLALHTVEEIRFTGAEGHPIQMFVLHPPSAFAPGPKPLVHMIHGGPHGVFGDGWHWRWCAHLLGSPGYVVALVNFHGSTSWGQEFARCIQGRWGDQPYQDIVAATDLLVERGIADPARMAATGGSYGGYMASWIASQTDRFACIVNHAGVCDLQMEWASDITQGWEAAQGGSPWDDLEGMDRWNPIRHAAGFKSPMLVIHGEQDYRVPYDQGLQIYNIYKAMRLPARLVCYPDENHWILKPRNSRHWYGEFLGWLQRWLG